MFYSTIGRELDHTCLMSEIPIFGRNGGTKKKLRVSGFTPSEADSDSLPVQ